MNAHIHNTSCLVFSLAMHIEIYDEILQYNIYKARHSNRIAEITGHCNLDCCLAFRPTFWGLRWLILYVNLARPWFPDMWSHMSLDVSVKVFFR